MIKIDIQHILDIVIAFGSTSMFIYSFLFLDGYDTETQSYVLHAPTIICPIVAIHRMFMMVYKDKWPRLRDTNPKLALSLFIQRVKDELNDQKRLRKEFWNKKKEK